MGQFKVEVVAVGGHGCQREIKDGGTVDNVHDTNCPDCAARHLVGRLQKMGCSIELAQLTHWPGQESQVVDDLLSKKRHGSF